MKKFKTSEDLNELNIRVPVNMARSLLTMARMAAEDATRVLIKAKEAGVDLGKLQKEALEHYVADYKLFRDMITCAILNNVSLDDQEVIYKHENAIKVKLNAELAIRYPGRINEAHDCDDPQSCTSCDAIQQRFPKQSVEEEFDLSELPEGTIIVPGNKEEN